LKSFILKPKSLFENFEKNLPQPIVNLARSTLIAQVISFVRRMQPEFRREIEYLNLGMVSEAKVTMEVDPTLEVEIREGQLEDAKLKEI
jgi:hypothetical protein